MISAAELQIDEEKSEFKFKSWIAVKTPDIQLIATEPKLQILTIKPKYLASSYFSDNVNVSG